MVTWRASLQDARAEERLLNEALYQAARPRVATFIERLQQAKSPDEFYGLHLDVLKEFAARQIAVSQTLPTYRANTRAEIAELIQQAPKPIQRLQVLNDVLTNVKRQERVADALQHALRVVADGIAWKALDYNRAAVTVLGRGPRVGRFAIGPGFDAELDAIGALWDKGLFAIHNDMTNCLRHGDLTVVRFSTPKEINFAEIKVKNLASAGAQMQRIDEVVALLRTGVSDAATSGLPTQILHIAGQRETFLGELRRLVAAAGRERIAWSRPHPAITVGAINYGVPDKNDHTAKTLAAMQGALKWDGPPQGFRWTGAERRMRDRAATPSNFAPLSIYPLPANDVADLILGFVDTMVYLDIPALERAFAERGLVAQVARPPESYTLFLRASDGVIGIRVPPEEREVMLNELVHPDALIAGTRALLEHTRITSVTAERILLAFAKEEDMWV